MLILCRFLVLLASVSSLKASSEIWTPEEFENNTFCSNDCTCTSNDNDDYNIISCPQYWTENKTMIKISNIFGTFGIACENMTSISISNSTNYLENYVIMKENCTVIDVFKHNELIYDSEEEFEVEFDWPSYDNIEKELIYNKLFLLNIPLHSGIFDYFNNLKNLTISSLQMDLSVNLFSKLEDLLHLFINCDEKCSMDPFLFQDLYNLEWLTIEGNFECNWQEYMFQSNRKLKSFNLVQNKNVTFPRLLFADMMKLEQIVVSNTELEVLFEDIFYNSSNIENINLSKNKIKSLPKDIFKHQIKLSLLDLKYNQIEELLDGTFDGTEQLKDLYLSHNKLTNISRYLFAKLGKLQNLYLDSNNIKTIDNSFKNSRNIQLINLQHNQLWQNNIHSLFDELENLKQINLSYNSLNDFFISNKTLFNNLEELILCHNNISNINFDNWIVSSLPKQCNIDLSFNHLSVFKIEDIQNLERRANRQNASTTTLLFNLDENPINCDCSAFKFIQFINRKLDPQNSYQFFELNVRNLKCHKPNFLYDQLLRKFSSTDFVCFIKKDCPKGCECKMSLDDTLVFQCSSLKLHQLPTFPLFKDLNHTSIQLYAANNQIESIQLINIPDDLNLLDLRNNSLKIIPHNVLKRFESIDELHLSGNSWDCDCSAGDFVRFFHQFRSKIIDADHMFCADGRSFKSLEPKDLCIRLIEVGMVISILVLLSLICVIFKKQIKIWLYAHNCCLWWVTEEEADKDMIYDAFFVFSHFDDSFVTDTIINLEEKGFKCCVHHRDWKAGEMIVTQALKSIRTSRRIIVVLSPKFVESNWATWEFRVSLIHAFNQQRSRVIVIIYGNVSLIDDLDDDLRTYIAYNTYLDSEDKWFDEKLLYAMPHKTKPEQINSSLERIDDEIYNLANNP